MITSLPAELCTKKDTNTHKHPLSCIVNASIELHTIITFSLSSTTKFVKNLHEECGRFHKYFVQQGVKLPGLHGSIMDTTAGFLKQNRSILIFLLLFFIIDITL